MTKSENITLQNFVQEYRRDKADDKEWKNEFREWRDKVVTPLIQEDQDNKAVHAYLRGQKGNILAILGGILTLLLIINAIFNGFFHNVFQLIFIGRGK